MPIPMALAAALCLLPAASDAADAADEDALVQKGIEAILALQEGDGTREWPYEGVYRVQGRIPIGYRVGGSAICAMALLHTPAVAEGSAGREAVHRATEFVCAAIDHPLMAHEFESRYDVRGWGYTYALTFLLRLEALDAVPEGLDDRVATAIGFCLKGIAATEIPERGGWNYARRAGFDRPGPPSPFMTAPTLQALFEAAKQGYEVDAALVDRGLAALERSRTETGSFAYAGASSGARAAVPGAVGRMPVAETTLFLAGRGDLARVRGSIDAFFTHWRWLEQRRRRNGTHVPPYGIAPYYFFYAHYYAAQAIELLPETDRLEYRSRMRELLLTIREDDGSWNDRVFPRSANYGTAMALMSLTMPEHPAPATWTPAEQDPLR